MNLFLLMGITIFLILKIFLVLPYYLKPTHLNKATANLNPCKTEIRHQCQCPRSVNFPLY